MVLLFELIPEWAKKYANIDEDDWDKDSAYK